MRAGLYARVSDTEQLKGYSLQEQLIAMRKFCEAQGWQVVREYTEPGFTGTTGDRPVFNRVLADCPDGPFDVLVTHDMDRFFRNIREKLEILACFARWGIVYASVHENLIVEDIDKLSPEEWLLVVVRGTISQFYVKNLSRETKKGKQGRARAGKSNASLLPHGYDRRQDGAEVINQEQAEAVRLAFEEYATGQYTDQGIANLLTRRGYKPHKGIRGGKWTRDNVRYLLRNRYYTGMVYHDGKWLPGQQEPLVEADLFEKAQATRRQRAHRGGGGTRTGRIYLLGSIARCSHCGGTLHCAHVRTPKGIEHDYYRDPAKVLNLDCPVAGAHVPMAEIDDQIDELVRRLVLPEDWRERLEELAEHREERNQVEGRRRYLRGKLRRLRDLYLEGDFDKDEYDRLKAQLLIDLDGLRQPETPEVEEAGATLEALADAWEGAPMRLRAEMLRTIFEAVIVDVAARRLVCVKPWPPFAVLFRLDGLEEKENGCFYPKDEKA